MLVGLVVPSGVGGSSRSVNGLRMSGLVGNASRYTEPDPEAPKPRGTASPDALSMNSPAPPALSFNMSRRVTRTFWLLLIALPSDVCNQLDAATFGAWREDFVEVPCPLC